MPSERDKASENPYESPKARLYAQRERRASIAGPVLSLGVCCLVAGCLVAMYTILDWRAALVALPTVVLGMFLVGPIGGAYADRLPKRRVIALGQLISGLVFGALGLLYMSQRLMLVHLVVGAFLIVACFAMLGPARQALGV